MSAGDEAAVQCMESILGHEHAKDILQSALRSGRMHHAWIFHGPQGVGKQTMAAAVARMLLCHNPGAEGASCGICPSCRLDAKAHPDLHLIYKELAAVSDFRHLRERKQMNIPVDLLREHVIGGHVGDHYIDPAVGVRPMLNHGKAFIIDEADLLDLTGQNSLLKTLEEPPPGTYLFLITSNDDRLLPTIRSRCQRVPFSALDDELVKQWLADQPAAQDLSPDQRAWVVRFARGSIGRAALALEYRLDAWAQAVGPMIDRVASGRPDVEMGPAMAGLVDGFAESWVKAHKGASKEAANKAGVRHMLGLIAETCRLRLRDAAAGADPADPITPEDAAHPWLAGIDLVQDAERNLESNVNVSLLLENLAIQWPAAGRGLRLAT